MFCYRFYYRIIKEKIGYEGEIEKKRTEVQKMIDQKKDSHDINKQVSFFYLNLLYVLVNLLIYVVHNLNFYKQKEVLAESEMMIPDCLKRLDKGILDLENFLKVNFLFFILIFPRSNFYFYPAQDIGTASPLEQTEEMKEARKALSDGKNMLQAAAAASGETLHK